MVLLPNTSGITFCDREKIREGKKEELQGKVAGAVFLLICHDVVFSKQ